MKTQRIILSYDEVNKVKKIATGVQGGGFVGIYQSNQYEGTFSFGTKEYLTDENAFSLLPKNKSNLLYLKEGEEIYTSTPYNKSEIYVFFITYYNNEQFASEKNQQAPINLTGTIQLNQQ